MSAPREKERLAQLDELDIRHWTRFPNFPELERNACAGLAVDDYLMLPEQRTIALDSENIFLSLSDIFCETKRRFLFIKKRRLLPVVH